MRNKKIICLLAAVLAVGLSAFFLWPEHLPVTAALSEDLNPQAQQSEYDLRLTWPAVECEAISLEINDQEFMLEPTATIFEIPLTEPMTQYQIRLTARKKGGKTAKGSATVTTLGDNEQFVQTISNLSLTDSSLTFTHLVEGIEPASLQYQVRPLFGAEPIPVAAKVKDGGEVEVTVPLENYGNDICLLFTYEGSNEQGNYFGTLRTDGAPLAFNSKRFEIAVDAAGFEMFNRLTAAAPLDELCFFGESLHLFLQEGQEPDNFVLKNDEGIVAMEGDYGLENNEAIPLKNLDPGRYYILANDMPLTCRQELFDSWYTVTRQGEAHHITLVQENGLVALNVFPVKELPAAVYDLIIDPGHGGMDTGTSGNGLFESEEVLKISKYMARRFQEHGLKVKLTRDTDDDPAGPGNYHYIESPYYDGGRVEQVYRHQAKYLISNHLNAVGGGIMIEGYELYTSVLTNNDWSLAVAGQLNARNRLARDAMLSEYQVSPGSFKKWSGDMNGLDYLFMMREIGGRLSGGTAQTRYNPTAYPTVPVHGAEGMLVEYAYIDNPKEAKLWENNYRDWAEAVIAGTCEYLEIEYKEN